MTFLEFYTGVVMDLAEGKAVTFNVATSKPRVRDATHVHGSSARMRTLEATRRDSCIRALRREHNDLAYKYTVKSFEVLPPTQ